ncbi:unnamed protein product [Notodromas monacha]|uniref:Uncharacterized protein n=1 Tax=Notodromas monacha TaxID=399045 RepID=A0A7R9BG29_9CRUS|nr:unnamed protein product [Notodromas monacha]CAG0913502.1 unnamed protein product [Notodromas monacha]
MSRRRQASNALALFMLAAASGDTESTLVMSTSTNTMVPTSTISFETTSGTVAGSSVTDQTTGSVSTTKETTLSSGSVSLTETTAPSTSTTSSGSKAAPDSTTTATTTTVLGSTAIGGTSTPTGSTTASGGTTVSSGSTTTGGGTTLPSGATATGAGGTTLPSGSTSTGGGTTLKSGSTAIGITTTASGTTISGGTTTLSGSSTTTKSGSSTSGGTTTPLNTVSTTGGSTVTSGSTTTGSDASSTGTVGFCRSHDGDALGKCFHDYVVTLPNDLSTYNAIQAGATKYFSSSNLDEADMQRSLLRLTPNAAFNVMTGIRAVLKAQRVRVVYKTQFLTQASDFQTGVGTTVSDLADGYLFYSSYESGNQLSLDDVKTEISALLSLFEKQMSPRVFAIALRKVPPLYLKPIILNLQMYYVEEYKNLSHPKSDELIRNVASNFSVLLERNNGIQHALVVTSLTPGSVDLNAEVTYEKINPNTTTDPLTSVEEGLKKDPKIGSIAINPDKSVIGTTASFGDKLMNNKGQDHKMLIAVTVPSFIGIFLFILLILCCTSAAFTPSKMKKPSA